MKHSASAVLVGILFAGAASAQAPSAMSASVDCSFCKEWNQPQKPFKVYGNAYYVGTTELSAMLITSPKGHILLDGALPQSAPLIAASIKALGFRLKDVKLILNSHAHFDHGGGIAALQQLTGAQVAASVHGARVLEEGEVGKDDPQYDTVKPMRSPKVARVRGVADGETVQLGQLAVTAHLTPGHTPGSTTWTWKSCEGSRCLDMVFADSLTPVSTDGFRYTGDATTAERMALFRKSVEKVGALKCDVIVSTHPGFTDTLDKLAARTKHRNPFIDPAGCRTYAASSMLRLDRRAAEEAATAPASPR